MKPKHTPGPWHLHKKQTEHAFRIDAKGDEWQELATVYQVSPYTHLMEQGEANARLIAAAPELLTCLENLTALVGNAPFELSDEQAAMLDQAVFAILKARAEGEK